MVIVTLHPCNVASPILDSDALELLGPQMGMGADLFQPPSWQRTFSGWSMRSLANFHLSECQPLPRLGANPVRVSALHQN